MTALARDSAHVDVHFLPSKAGMALLRETSAGAGERHENVCVTMLELGHLNL